MAIDKELKTQILAALGDEAAILERGHFGPKDQQDAIERLKKLPIIPKVQHFSPPKIITTAEMQLADVVQRVTDGPEAYMTATVTQVKNVEGMPGIVELMRPYVQTADFSYTGGVIGYLGVENYQIWRDDKSKWMLFRREELL